MTCRVRLRPQLYNDVRLNRTLIQCESCQRILYYPPATGRDGRAAVHEHPGAGRDRGASG